MTDSASPDESLLTEPGVSAADFRQAGETIESGDRRDGKFYRYTYDIKLAVRVALAVGRPMLLFGPSGCGKSSMVFNLARLLRRRYYEFVVNSRSEARDLYYRFDAVRRLGEAQLRVGATSEAHELWRHSYPFIEPGPLWWVYSPETAALRGSREQTPGLKPANDPGRWPPDYGDTRDRGDLSRQPIPPAVLLIDEIDKADPDFPNNLLVPLGSREFSIAETGDIVRLQGLQGSSNDAPLVVITSNKERDLPVAFIRRCVVLEIPSFKDEDLIELAKATFRRDGSQVVDTWKRIADLLRETRPRGQQVSPAEYLDTIRAIELLDAANDGSKWKDIVLRTSWTSDMATSD
jgi:MoxR-like ATPase